MIDTKPVQVQDETDEPPPPQSASREEVADVQPEQAMGSVQVEDEPPPQSASREEVADLPPELAMGSVQVENEPPPQSVSREEVADLPPEQAMGSVQVEDSSEEEEVLPSTDEISDVEERGYCNFSTTTNAVMNLELAFVESEGMKKLYTNTEKVSC